MTSRSNGAWLADLRDPGESRQLALGDLRQVLLRGLRRGLAASRLDEAFLEDAVQEALIRILSRLPQFEGRSRFVTWATSIALHIAISELRRRRWRDVSLEELTRPGDLAPDGEDAPGPMEQCQRRDLVIKLREIIERDLSEKQRTALVAELKGMPQEEIARQLGSTRNAVYKLTHDARRRLKLGLETAGYRADDVRSAFAS